ncbi:MAG TPA: hypothetical protein DFR83_15335, partial [Deltaproteobacteria bacterium]|nr:hypothetical protein [Deltaproteobacteria bacterium]
MRGRMTAAFALIGSTACSPGVTPAHPSDCAPSRAYRDLDQDGYGGGAPLWRCADEIEAEALISTGGDCDDTAARVNPGVSESCNDIDDDCDGDTDEGDAADASTWYADTDTDSFGDPDVSTTACEQPSGYVSDSTDCDDGDVAVNPDATEVCNDIDDDCNDGIDEGDAADASTW